MQRVYPEGSPGRAEDLADATFRAVSLAWRPVALLSEAACLTSSSSEAPSIAVEGLGAPDTASSMADAWARWKSSDCEDHHAHWASTVVLGMELSSLRVRRNTAWWMCRAALETCSSVHRAESFASSSRDIPGGRSG